MNLSQLIKVNPKKITQVRVTSRCNIPNISVKGGSVKSLTEQIGKPLKGKIDLDDGKQEIIKGQDGITYKPI